MLTSVGIGYLLGSIPFGYLLVRRFRGADVRTTGSGNIGATNVARTSPLLGILTLLLDALKGLTAVALILAIFPDAGALGFVAACAAICGHVFPVWLGFRGGKGVATGFGSFLLLTPKAILIAIGLFLAMAAAFRWVALASMVATASLPLTVWWMGVGRALRPGASNGAASSAAANQPLIWITVGAALIIVKHHSNIRRMLSGTEPRLRLKP
jgi:acyl phosphate:glycerol-3-phosphate acyltransferase